MKYFTAAFHATELHIMFKDERCFHSWLTRNYNKFSPVPKLAELIEFRKKQIAEGKVSNEHMIPCKLARTLRGKSQ